MQKKRVFSEIKTEVGMDCEDLCPKLEKVDERSWASLF